MTSVGISLALSFPNILLFILNKFIWKKEHINCIFVVLSFIFHYGISNIIVEFVTFGKLVIIIYSILFALLNLCLSFGKIKLNKSGFIYLFKKLFAKSINQVVDSQRILTTRMNDDLTSDKNKFETVDHLKGYTEQGFRWIPITPNAMKVLKKVKKINPDGKYIFMLNNKQLYTNSFNDYLNRRCMEIGVTPRTSHKIRFTVASILFLDGMNISDLQKLLGHTSINMTMHYIRKITSIQTASRKMEKTLDKHKNV